MTHSRCRDLPLTPLSIQIEGAAHELIVAIEQEVAVLATLGSGVVIGKDVGRDFHDSQTYQQIYSRADPGERVSGPKDRKIHDAAHRLLTFSQFLVEIGRSGNISADFFG